jgi:hypothetical protein
MVATTTNYVLSYAMGSNAEDFYAALVAAAKKYFDALQGDRALRTALEERAQNPGTGVLVVGPLTGTP